MKKIIIFILAIFAVLCLIGCESDPIEPQIIGITHLKTEKGIIYAEIDSVRYVPTEILTGEKTGKDGMAIKIKPIDGMLVTCFTCKKRLGITFFAGEVTAEEIEQFYYTNNTVFIFIFGISVIFIGTMIFIINNHVFKNIPKEALKVCPKNKTKTSSSTQL